MTVSVEWQLEEGTVLIGAGVRLPRRLVATYDDGELPLVKVTVSVMDGVPVCDRVDVARRPDGVSLTGDELRRVPIAEIVELACRQAALTQVEASLDGSTAWEPPWGDAQRERQVRRDVQRARQRRVFTDALLRDVARIYRANPGRPTAAVREAFNVSAAQASRYVRAARDRHHLEGKP